MRAERWWMLAVTCLSVVVVSLDLTVLNIALPSISVALHAGTGDLQWLVDAYALVFAGVMLPAGLAGDRLGRKRLLLAGLTVFLAASLWCALSVSAAELIAARAVMGLGAGIVFPLSLAVVSAAFGDDDRPKAIGILTAGIAVGLPLGPVLGGLLLQHFAWSSVFWINVPAAAVTLAAGAVLMPESCNPAALPLDMPGALASVGTVTGLVWGVINGQERGWSAPATWALLAGSAVLLAAFLLRQRRSANPVIDPALFRDRRFTWGTAATIAVSVALYAILFIFPQYLQSVLADDPAIAGLRLLPMMGGLLVAGAVAGQAVQAAGTRVTVAVGLTLLAVGLALLSQVRLSTDYAFVAAGLALCGLGTGTAIGAAMDAVMGAAGGGEAGTGASVNSALRQASGAVTVAALGSVLSARYARALAPAIAALPRRDAALARGSVTEAMQLAGRLPSASPALRAAAGSAFLDGMSTVMLICAAVAVLAVVTSLRYLPGRAAPGSARSPQAPRDPGPGAAYATMALVTETEPDWRQRKKNATRDRIRASALRLFGEQGYDATTVEQIAAAAGVSHMTFFRYFPAKEDVALSDSYDPLLARLLQQAPATSPLADRIRTALVQGLRQLYDANRDTLLAQNKLIIATPALRERLWASQMNTQRLILQALDAGQDGPHPSFADRVTVAACLAAATTAVLTWVENDGTPELPDLIEQAFDALARPR